MDNESSKPQALGQDEQASQIADLLVGGAEEESEVQNVSDEQDESTDSDDEETLSEESTEEESDEESSDDTEEGDLSWEGVLGLEEGQIDYDEDGNPKAIVTKVDGVVEPVPLKDIIAGYQTNKAITQRGQALAEERKAFEAEAETARTEFKTKLEQADLVTNYLSNKLVEEFNSVDWDALRREDPAEYAALKQDYAVRAQEYQQALQAVQAEKEQLNQQEAIKQAEQAKAFVEEQRKLMLDKNPSWSNPEVFTKDMTELKTFLGNRYGFTDNDFNQVRDARLIELIKDAKKFNDGVKVAEKKVKKPVPKFQKSSGTAKKSVSKLDKLVKAAKSAKGSNRRDAQADAVALLLTGG